MSATSAAVRKAKDAIRTRGSDLCDIIVNGGFTRIANECEVKGIITIDSKKKLTSDMINKDESSRAYELLDIIRSSLATYNLHKPMDDFLCIIHQYGGSGRVAITQEIARECKPHPLWQGTINYKCRPKPLLWHVYMYSRSFS